MNRPFKNIMFCKNITLKSIESDLKDINNMSFKSLILAKCIAFKKIIVTSASRVNV